MTSHWKRAQMQTFPAILQNALLRSTAFKTKRVYIESAELLFRAFPNFISAFQQFKSIAKSLKCLKQEQKSTANFDLAFLFQLLPVLSFF